MENNQDYIDELVARCLAGNGSSQDEADLAAWRAVSEENEHYFQDLKFIFDIASKIIPHREVNTNKAWDTISGRIEKETIPVITMETGQNFSSRLMRYAAVVILLIGIPSLLFYIAERNKVQNERLVISASNSDVPQTLPDGSKVIVKANSTLTALQSKNETAREYQLTGEAKFKVVHNDAVPFIIHADKTLISDIGTEFDIKLIPDTVMVSVQAGMVNFYRPGVQGIILQKGKKGLYIKSLLKFIKQEPKSKFSGDLTFENATLYDVATELFARYGVAIRFENEKIKTCRITVKFKPTENVNDMVEIIKQTFALQSETKDNVIILSGKGCE